MDPEKRQVISEPEPRTLIYGTGWHIVLVQNEEEKSAIDSCNLNKVC